MFYENIIDGFVLVICQLRSNIGFLKNDSKKLFLFFCTEGHLLKANEQAFQRFQNLTDVRNPRFSKKANLTRYIQQF